MLLALLLASVGVACSSARERPTMRVLTAPDWERASACLTSLARDKGYTVFATASEVRVWRTSQQRPTSIVGTEMPPTRRGTQRDRIFEEVVFTRADTPAGYVVSSFVHAVDYGGGHPRAVPVASEMRQMHKQLERLSGGAAGLQRAAPTPRGAA